MIKLAKYASSMLKGMAAGNISKGKKPRFPVTSHINTKPTNQDKKVVCTKVNFLLIMKIKTAKQKDQIPHTAPLTGNSGNISPSFS